MKGPWSLAALGSQLDRYEELLVGLADRGRAATLPAEAAVRSEREARLREPGAKTTSMVLEMAANERRFVEGRLAFTKQVPLFFLVVTLFLSIFVANFLARQMVGPLGRLVKATQRIAGGSASPRAWPGPSRRRSRRRACATRVATSVSWV
jgi:nitrate/nitrite-specific signal transduction histidine kinase